MPRKIKKIWVIAKEGSPVAKPGGGYIYHHHPIQITDSTWARKKVRKEELTLCTDVETKLISPASTPAPAEIEHPAPGPDVLGIMIEMVDKNENLTMTGKPELAALNEKLEAEGLDRIDPKKRDELYARIIKEDNS